MPNKSANPELDNDKKKRLVQQYLQKLIKTDPNLYYSSTTDIARSLHPMIKEHMNRMPVDEQALFKNVTVRDIEMLLSFH